MLRDLLTGIEFLTRLRFSARKDWREDDFSNSVPYFPLVGLIMGLGMALANCLLIYLVTPAILRAVLLILAELFLIGALMYDGYMDTADGVFSARKRERVLEIMKDSHVGANAVIALFTLILLKVAAYFCIDPSKLTPAFIAMFTATRTFMVNYIVNFRCARADGLARMFKASTKSFYVPLAFAVCLFVCGYCGLIYLLAACITFVVTLLLALYLRQQLGGLTGDTYGFLTECGAVCYLLLIVYLSETSLFGTVEIFILK